MARPKPSLICAATVLCLLAGCSHLVESRAIDRFTGAIGKQDDKAIKAATSRKFEDRALRLAGAVEDLSVLDLPGDDIKITAVEELDDDRRRVVVEDRSNHRQAVYLLTREADSGRWVVDDVELTQQRGRSKTTRSVSDLMDLLLSVREFRTAWQGTDRDIVLGVVTRQLRTRLKTLPPSYLARLTRRVFDPEDGTDPGRPLASLDGDSAQVRIAGSSGTIVLVFSREDGRWQVDDIALPEQIGGKRVESVRQLAALVGTTAAFLEAYQVSDRKRLEQLCTPRLYRDSLAVADLSRLPLPGPDLLDQSDEVRLQERFSDFVIRQPERLVRISLEATDGEQPYRVRDVTIYEYAVGQEKRLSSVFTAHARMQLFAGALADRDLASLKHNATADFNNRVWSLLVPSSIGQLPIDGIPDAPRVVTATVFRGPVTRVTVLQGTARVTYVLKNQKGALLVDDVLVDQPARPSSLKETLERVIPMQEFAAGIRLGLLDVLKQHSSKNFKRLVWDQVRELPEEVGRAVIHLRAPLAAIRVADDRTSTVVLGDDRFGAVVHLVPESGRQVIDDIQLVAGLEQSQRQSLKQVLRLIVAEPLKSKPSPNRDP